MRNVLKFVVLVLVLSSCTAMLRAEEVKPVNIAIFNPLQLFPATTSIEGLSVCMISSVNEDVTGIAWGLVTRANGDFLGFQDSFVSRVRGKMTGVQSGFVNSAGEVNGVQFGLINYAGTLNGIQLGLLNINASGPMVVFPIVNVAFK